MQSGNYYGGRLVSMTNITGERLRLFRKRAGLSLRQAAPLIGVSAMALSNWETGRTVPASPRLIAAARAYGCKATDLMYQPPGVKLTVVHWHKTRER